MRITPEELIAAVPKDSWFHQWCNSWPTVEMPWSFLLFGAMSVLGSALGRSVWFQDDWRRLWPMLNLLLIGPSGIGKSSSIELNQSLLMSLPIEDRPQFIIGSATPEKLHADLMVMPQAILYASELANFFNKQKYMEGMIPYVTELLDCKPIERRTISGNIQRIDEPTTTVIGGSTVEWLQEQLPDSAVGGGFLPRFLVVKEDIRRQRVPNAEMALSKSVWKETMVIREKAYDGFYKLLKVHSGPVKFQDYDVADAYGHWYLNHQPPVGHLAPFAARAPEFVKRMSMLLAISSGRGNITVGDLEAAIQMYYYVECKLQEVVVPKSAHGKLLTLVLGSIPPFGATDVEIKKAMRNFLPSQEIDKYLFSLLSSQDIRFVEGKYFKQEGI